MTARLWRHRVALFLISLAVAIAVLLAGGCATTLRQDRARISVTPTLASDHATMADGYRLPVTVWRPSGPPRAVVLALHGFNDYRHAFQGLGGDLAAAGIVTYAYDQRGFGETAERGIWPGRKVLTSDARTMVGLLHRRYPDTPVYLLGHSMGGAVAMTAVAGDHAVKVAGTVLVAPAVWARSTMPWYQRLALWVVAHTVPGWRPTGESLHVQPSDNVPMLRALGRDPLVIKKTRMDTTQGLVNLMDAALAASSHLRGRGIILYGAHDQLIPRKPFCDMIGRLPDDGAAWNTAYYPDGYHMLTRDLHGGIVRKDIASWILHPEAALPSQNGLRHAAWADGPCRSYLPRQRLATNP